MSNRTFIIGLVLIVIALGGMYFILTGNHDKTLKVMEACERTELVVVNSYEYSVSRIYNCGDRTLEEVYLHSPL